MLEERHSDNDEETASNCYVQDENLDYELHFYVFSNDYMYDTIANTLVFNLCLVLFLTVLFLMLWSRTKYGWRLRFLSFDDSPDEQRYSFRKEYIGPPALQFYNWLKLDADFLYQTCGPYGSKYLVFHRHIVLFTAGLTLTGLLVILPLNLQGPNFSSKTFAATSVSNLSSRSKMVIFHDLFGWSILPLTLAFLKLFMISFTSLTEDDVRKCKTFCPVQSSQKSIVMLLHLPENLQDRVELRNYLNEEYPTMEISDLQINVRYEKVLELKKERQTLRKIVEFCSKDKSADLQPIFFLRPFSRLLAKRSRFEHYRKKLVDIEDKYEAAMAKLKTAKPIDSAFISLHSEMCAKEFVLIQTYRYRQEHHFSSSHAPDLENVLWGEMIDSETQRIRVFMVNLLAVVVLVSIGNPELFATVSFADLPSSNFSFSSNFFILVKRFAKDPSLIVDSFVDPPRRIGDSANNADRRDKDFLHYRRLRGVRVVRAQIFRLQRLLEREYEE